MKALARVWRQWADRFAALSRRERMIVAAAVVLGGGLMIFNLALDPQLARIRKATLTLATAQAELGQRQGLLADLRTQAVDPDASHRNTLATVRKELADVNGRLATMEAGMVPPERMRGFLEGLLARNRGIELLGIRTLPPTLVGAQVSLSKLEQIATQGVQAKGEPPPGPDRKDANPAKVPPNPAAGDGIYQHGIEIRLAGSYNDLLDYLAELERMPQQLLWNSVSLSVERYPRNVLVLRLYTLSLDRNWLTV